MLQGTNSSSAAFQLTLQSVKHLLLPAPHMEWNVHAPAARYQEDHPFGPTHWGEKDRTMVNLREERVPTQGQQHESHGDSSARTQHKDGPNGRQKAKREWEEGPQRVELQPKELLN